MFTFSVEILVENLEFCIKKGKNVIEIGENITTMMKISTDSDLLFNCAKGPFTVSDIVI